MTIKLKTKMKVVVTRQSDDGTQTLGDMHVYNEAGVEVFKCDTLELPDLNNDGIEGNEKGKSCIPKGTYICHKRAATANIPYEHILINNVVGRDGICIHKANYVSQLRGCIAVGASEVDMNGDGHNDITSSGMTFHKLMLIVPNIFNLTVQ